MKKQYLVHLCGGKNHDCQDVWIAVDSESDDPEQLALDLFPHVDAVRLLFDETGLPIFKEVKS